MNLDILVCSQARVEPRFVAQGVDLRPRVSRFHVTYNSSIDLMLATIPRCSAPVYVGISTVLGGHCGLVRTRFDCRLFLHQKGEDSWSKRYTV